MHFRIEQYDINGRELGPKDSILVIDAEDIEHAASKFQADMVSEGGNERTSYTVITPFTPVA